MKRYLLILLTTLIPLVPASAQKFITQSGFASFFSSAPLEDIAAENHKVSSIIDFNSGEVAVNIRIRDYHFDKSLMEEHFNENYLESDRYPNSSFKGKFESTRPIEPAVDGIYPVKVKGVLTLHGVTRNLETDGTIEVKNGEVKASTAFKVALQDYKIKIPRLVIKNIAEVVDVKIDLAYHKMNDHES
jgi:hypothetical protein